MVGYKGKYLRTYFWSGLALVLNFFSMFIVAPLTTSMPEAYGVYSICISFTIFLRYADLGFIEAGRKYAAEAFSVNNHELEQKYVGTSMSIYGGMTLILFVFALFFSTFPEYLISDIDVSPYYKIAHQLLLILALTIPLSIVQKFVNLIYSVRIEEYRIQSFQILGSIIKIASVPLYFFHNRYDIVGYYLFCEIVSLLINLFVLFYSRNIGYGFQIFFQCLKFDKQIFNEIKPLALSGFVSVIGWVSYYELDMVAISILLGANAVAIYVIGKTIHQFVRSLIGIVFSPYPVRINYFIGQKDFEGLKNFFYNLAELFSIIVIPIVVIVLYAKPLVIAWVGYDYEQSIFILQLLVPTFILHHVTSLGSSVVYGLNKVKDILKIAFIQPLFFWIGVLVSYRIWGVGSFAIFKLAACLISEFYYCYLVKKYLGYGKKEFYWGILMKPVIVILFVCMMTWSLIFPFLDNVEKSRQDLLLVVFCMGLNCIVALAIDACINKSLRHEVKEVVCAIWCKIN